MNRLIALLDSEFCGNLLTALMHSLWQAVVIAGFLLLFLKNKTAKDANVRYIAALIALTAIVLCGLFTWAVLDYEPSVANETLVTDSLSPERTASAVVQAENNDKSILIKQKSIESDVSSEVLAKFNWQLSMMCLWLIGVMVMLLRTLCVVVGGGRLRRQCRALEDEHILALVEQLRRSIGITLRIRVAAGENISVPGVVGCIWPTLLLPISMVSGIPTNDLRAILAHELAHIRRYDYLVNFCQMVTEAILFFNPTVWWISKQIRFEREACCDAAGIIATGQRIRYAEVLAKWAKRLKDTKVTIVSTTIGFCKAGDSSGMLERVRRIVVAGHHPKLRVSWYIATATLILSLVLLVGLWRGTNLAVVLAGRILSPQERIEKITEISKEYGFEDREYSEEDKIHLSGITITYDGRSLPKDASITVHSKRPGHGTSKSISTSKSGHFREEGSFKCRVEFGRVFVVARASGYAPVFAGPFEAEPGGSIDGIKLVLEQGQVVRGVLLDDETGWPIPGADVYGYCHQKKNGKFQYEKLHAESETNERGEFIFSNMAKRQYNIGVSGANIANRREQVMAIGGQKEPVIIRVKINNWSNLKPHKPMGEDN